MRPYERNLPLAEQTQREHLADLVARYEAVPHSPRSPERDAAETALGLALSCYGRPFEHKGQVWYWSHAEQSITRARSALGHVVHDARHHAAAETCTASPRRRRDGDEMFGGWSLKGRAV